MKKLLFGLIAVVAFFNLSFGQPSSEEVYRHLQTKYGFEKIDFKQNESKNETLINSLKNNTFIKSSINLSEINLSDISIIYHKDGNKSLLIPYIKNSKYNLVISLKIDDFTNFLNVSLVKNDINAEGNGYITYMSSETTFSDKFVNGKKEVTINSDSSKASPNCFRRCFDNAYNDICDGAIGCASWYSSPLPALTAVAYCYIKC